MRRLAVGLLLILVVSGCSGSSGEPAGSNGGGTATTPTTAPPSSGPADTATTKPPHPVSLPALMRKRYDGRGLRIGEEVYRTSRHRQYAVTYRSGHLRISGRIAVPNGTGPFPTVVLAHGYIDPAIYVNGQGMTRERAWLGDRGYVALHVDYRNHAASSDDPAADVNLRLGYTEDVINAVHALRKWRGPVDDERVAVVGRSMGGGVVYNVLTVKPGLVDAGVAFAPVSSDTVDNFDRWIRHDPGRVGVAQQILRRYGDPARQRNRKFWRNASPRSFFDHVTEPVLIHHGTADDTCPPAWSRATAQALEDAGADVTIEWYQGEGHAFGPQFFASMERTDRFLRRHLR